MWRKAARVASASLLSCAAMFANAQTITVQRLQALLHDAPKHALYFHETRESPWLSAPVESSGDLRFTSAMLEKEALQPRHETWRMLDDRLQMSISGVPGTKEILFSQAPGVAVLANALRHAVAGDLVALDKDFDIAPGGDEHLWTLQLTPRDRSVVRFLKTLELQGTGTDLQVIVTVSGQGERTTTRLTREP